MEYTLALIKPDACKAGRAAEMCQLAQLHGFSIVAKQQLQLTQHMAEEFYGEHKGKPFYPGLVEFMTSGPIMAVVLAKKGAIAAWRELMGPTDVFEARVRAPKTMRALYGTDGTRNSCHGSDSPSSAAREIKFFFPDLKLSTTAAAGTEDAKAYIDSKLNPTLLKALTALAKEKPSSKPHEAVVFLATWLLEHNPNKPRVALSEEQKQQLQAAAAAATRRQEAQEQQQKAKKVSSSRSSSSGSAGNLQTEAVQQQDGVAASTDDKCMQDAAATKVQAAFRGHQARRQVAELRDAAAAADGGSTPEPAAVASSADAQPAAVTAT